MKGHKCKKRFNDMNNATQCERDIFPFQSLSDSDLIHLSFNSNTDCLCSDQISKTKLSLLPRFDNVAAVSKVPHLSDLDADQNFPSQSNFKYYSVHDFHVDEEIKNISSSDSFSVLQALQPTVINLATCYLI